MFQIYILSSLKTPRTYVGFTNDLEERLRCHNNSKVTATKNFRPWKVIYTEQAGSITEGKKREKYWKSGAGRRNLKKIIAGSRPTFRKLGEARSSC